MSTSSKFEQHFKSPKLLPSFLLSLLALASKMSGSLGKNKKKTFKTGCMGSKILSDYIQTMPI